MEEMLNMWLFYASAALLAIIVVALFVLAVLAIAGPFASGL